EASQHVATFFASPQFRDVLAGRPPALVGSTMASALDACWQGCAAAVAPDGSVPLDALIAAMRARYPEETPERYARVSWPQLIHDSGTFAIVRRDETGARMAPRVCRRTAGATP